jgi:hypothetical protein
MSWQVSTTELAQPLQTFCKRPEEALLTQNAVHVSCRLLPYPIQACSCASCGGCIDVSGLARNLADVAAGGDLANTGPASQRVEYIMQRQV